MNRVQTDKYKSLGKSRGLLKDNAAALATLPAVLVHAAELYAAFDRLGELMAFVEQDNTGYTKTKALRRKELTRTLMRLCRYACTYYLITGNKEMEILTNIRDSAVAKMTTADLYIYAGKMHDALVADAPLMPGTAPTDIAQLAAENAAFYAVIDSTENIRNARKAATAETIEVFHTAEAACQMIEIYLRTLIDSPQEDLYQLWRLSRNIDRTGVRSKKKKEE